MKVLRAKLTELPKTCPSCGGRIIKAMVRKQEQDKCVKCGERVSTLYEERNSAIPIYGKVWNFRTSKGNVGC